MAKFPIIVKIGLSILLFICLIDLPYGYYQFVRFAAMAGLAYLTYDNFSNGNKSFAFIFIALAILFQPIIKISLGRELWNVVDVVVGVFLIVSIFIKPKGQE
jgi:hypothetical protein